MMPLLMAALAAAGAAAGAPAAPLATAPALAPVDPAAVKEVLQRIFEGSKTAVVQVGADPRSSGTVISEGGLIATALPLARGTAVIPITFTNGFKATARVLVADAALGVALLRVEGLPSMAYLKMSPAPVAVGQAAYCLAFAKELSPVVTFSRVMTTSVIRDQRVDDRVFTGRCALDAKSIGEPVIGWSGEMMGLVLANDRAGTTFAVTSRALLDLVSGHAGALPTIDLALASDPQGAEALLDGRSVGETPVSLSSLPLGTHTLILRSPGLPDTVKPLVALGPAHLDLKVELLPGAPLTVETQPGAQVFIDGVLRSVGSATLWLPGGRHWVAVMLRGHRSLGRFVEVVEGRPLSLPAGLPESRASLTVETVPPGAEVFLDDNFVGASPLKDAAVTPGTFEMSLELRGYHAAKIPVTVAEGQALDVGKVMLQPPRATLHFHVPAETEVEIDGGLRHEASPLGELVAVGKHTAIFYAPFQYRTQIEFRAGDGQVVDLAPSFIAAGTAERQEVTRTIASVVEGGAGVGALVSMIGFGVAEADRETNGGELLSSSGRTAITVGLATGALALALVAGGSLIEAVQPTRDMGYAENAPRALR